MLGKYQSALGYISQTDLFVTITQQFILFHLRGGLMVYSVYVRLASLISLKRTKSCVRMSDGRLSHKYLMENCNRFSLLQCLALVKKTSVRCIKFYKKDLLNSFSTSTTVPRNFFATINYRL